jgi:hypothetical protein
MSIRATPTPLYVLLKNAQATFGPSRVTFWRAAKAGKINIYHAGHTSLLKVSEVEAWLSVRINGEKT